MIKPYSPGCFIDYLRHVVAVFCKRMLLLSLSVAGFAVRERERIWDTAGLVLFYQTGFSPVDSFMQRCLLGFQLCYAFFLFLQSPHLGSYRIKHVIYYSCL